MHRRSFLTLLGTSAAASAWPLAARAQQRAAMPVIGVLSATSPEDTAGILSAIREGLGETGFIEGRNLAIEYRFANNQNDLLPALAADLVRRQVAVIVTIPAAPTLAAKAATNTIPIVFVIGGDAVDQLGLVASYNRPGGNLTGVTGFTNDLWGKRVDLMRQLVPTAAVIAVLMNPNNPGTERATKFVQDAGQVLGLEILFVNTSTDRDIDAAFVRFAQQRVDAVLVQPEPFLTSRRDRIVALAVRYSIPAGYANSADAVAGGLISYSISRADRAYLNRQMGIYTGRILKGEKPGELPVVQPTRFELDANFMHRRSFLTLLGTSAAAWPLAARAQRAGRVPTIGLLGSSTPAAWAPWTSAFLLRLRELGWIEGRTVAIEYRWAEGRNERGAEIAAEFARMKVDVIVTTGSSALAVKDAILTVPVVFALLADPIGSGYIASLARPGGNATGLSIQTLDTAAKRLEILREVVPGLRRLAILARLDNPSNVVEVGEVEAAARMLGVEVITANARRAEDIVPAIEELKGRVDGLHIVSDPLLLANHFRINPLAIGARLPTMYSYREGVAAGGLMSYGTNFPDLGRRAAELVDKILRGAKPADIPVEQPTRFDLIVNLITAKALGLTIPETFLVRATEVIE